MTSSHPEYDSFAIEHPLTPLSEKRTIAWKFVGFADMEQMDEEKYESKSLECHGFSWYLHLYPRRQERHVVSGLPSLKQYTSIFLKMKGGEVVKLRKRVFFRVGSSSPNFDSFFNDFSFNERTGEVKMEREQAINLMTDGDLVVEVDIQVGIDEARPVLPRSILSQTMLEVLESGRRSDVTFVAGGKSFRAHLNILDASAPVLSELADGAKPGEDIMIDNVNDSVFNALLRFVYAEEPPPDELMEQNTRDILDAADRFGCVNLKLLAESRLVESGIDSDNAAELLLLAEAKSCALLKESTLNYIRVNGKAVMKSPGWEELKKSPSLLSQIIEVLQMQNSDVTGGDEVERMPVATLRRKLQEEGLSEDGTREMLVERVKGHAAKKRRTE